MTKPSGSTSPSARSAAARIVRSPGRRADRAAHRLTPGAAQLPSALTASSAHVRIGARRLRSDFTSAGAGARRSPIVPERADRFDRHAASAAGRRAAAAPAPRRDPSSRRGPSRRTRACTGAGRSASVEQRRHARADPRAAAARRPPATSARAAGPTHRAPRPPAASYAFSRTSA